MKTSHRLIVASLLSTVVLLASLRSAAAWDATGHVTVAAVAWRKLDAATKKILMGIAAIGGLAFDGGSA